MQKDFAIGMGATAAGVTGMMGTLMLSTLKETPAEKKIREARKKAREEKEKKKTTSSKKKTTPPGRGGGAGVYKGITQPIMDKTLKGKFGKRS
jgi:hypothetical protein